MLGEHRRGRRPRGREGRQVNIIHNLPSFTFLSSFIFYSLSTLFTSLLQLNLFLHLSLPSIAFQLLLHLYFFLDFSSPFSISFSTFSFICEFIIFLYVRCRLDHTLPACLSCLVNPVTHSLLSSSLHSLASSDLFFFSPTKRI